MRPSARFFRVVVSLAACLAVFTPVAWGLGFRNPDQSARATAQGEAFVATADDASAIYYNPAGLTQVPGTQVMAGSLYTFRDIKFDGSAGNVAMNDPGMLAHVYLVSDLHQDRWRFGFGVNVPYGLAINYGDQSPLRWYVTDASMRVFNLQPTIAYRINDQLSIGLGLNAYIGDTALENNIPLIPEGRFKFNGDGTAVGLTAGLLWRLNHQHSVGVVYRSPFTINFEGSAVVSPDALGILGHSPASTAIDFPQCVAVGYAFRPTPALKLEVNVDWTEWEHLNDAVLHSKNPAFDNFTIPFRWKNSFFYEFGAEYRLSKSWMVRAGYIFSEDTVPAQTFSPKVPDSDRHVFSTGLGYQTTRWGVDLTYQYALSPDRQIKNSTDIDGDGVGDLNGTWQSQAHTFLMTSTFRF